MVLMTDWGWRAEDAESRDTMGRSWTVRGWRGEAFRSASAFRGRAVLAPHRVHAPANHAQCVDVEAGVGLVQHGHAGLEQCHLQDLVALLLAAAEPLVEVATGKRFVH